MIAALLWCLLAVPGLPGAVVIATPRGQTSVPITLERGVAGRVAMRVTGTVAESPPPAAPTAATTPNPISGLRFRHTVVIDPGHGGADPGNPGRYFPNGLVEKDITLAIARLLRAELVRRGIAASLTRSTDTLIDLADPGGLCP